jgi:hypothetical protein
MMAVTREDDFMSRVAGSKVHRLLDEFESLFNMEDTSTTTKHHICLTRRRSGYASTCTWT